MNRFLIASGAIALSLFLSWEPVHSVQRQLSDGWSWSPPTAGTLDDAFQDFVLQFGTVCQGGDPSWSEGTLRGTTCTLVGSECSTGSGTCTEDVGDPVPFDSDIATNQDVRECRGVTVSLNSTAGTAPTDQVVSLFDCSASERTSAASCVYRGKLDSDTPTLNVSFARGFVLAEVNTTGVGGVIDIACNTMADRYFDGSVWADITEDIPLLSTPRRGDRSFASAPIDPRPAVLAIASAPSIPAGVASSGSHSPIPLCHYTLKGYPGFGGWAGTGDGSTVTYGHSRCQSGSPGADPTDPTDFSCYCERAWDASGHSYTIRENTYGGADIYYNPKTRKIVFDTAPAETQEINSAMQYYEDTGCDGGGDNCEGGPTDKEGRWESSDVSVNASMAAFINVYNDTNGGIIAKSAASSAIHEPIYCIPGNDNCEPPNLLNLMTGDYRGGNRPTTAEGRHSVKVVRSFDAETCWADHGVARVCFDGDCDGAGEGPPDNPMGINGDLGPGPKVSNGSSMRKMTGTSQDFDTCIRRSFGPEGGFALSVDKDASIGYWDFQEVTVLMDAGMVTNVAIESTGHPYRSGDGPLIISGGTACHIDDKAAYFASVIDENHFELAMDYQTAVRGHIRDTQDGPGDPTTSSGRGELPDFVHDQTPESYRSNALLHRTSGTCSNDASESCSEESEPHTHCKNIPDTGESPGAFCYEAPQSFDDNGSSFCTIVINKKGVEIPITRPVAQGTGDGNFGVLAWGDDTDATADTGAEICAKQMMKCAKSFDLSDWTTDTTCGAATGNFVAFCY